MSASLGFNWIKEYSLLKAYSTSPCGPGWVMSVSCLSSILTSTHQCRSMGHMLLHKYGMWENSLLQMVEAF